MKYSPSFSISGQTSIIVAQVISVQREMLSHRVPVESLKRGLQLLNQT
jgi:hypothetical protein